MPEVPARVRFAPSPTGGFHVGGARTALYNYLYARHTGGRFILRIEDTDRSRYEEDSLGSHLHGLRWLGLDWDEGPEVGGEHGPYFQSERLHLYQEYAQQLVSDGKAYYCFCSPKRLGEMRSEQHRKGVDSGYDGRCRHLTAAEQAEYRAAGVVPVVRIRMPVEGNTSFTDLIRGPITVENDTLDDLILLKSDGFPTYHLAVVVDDHLMRITHVMRGEEWLSSVPPRINLYSAFGWEPPTYVHLPTILDPSGKGKLSKRKKYLPGEKIYPVFVNEFERLGYLPEAMINYLARVGWSYDDKTEVFSREELISKFDLSGISKSAGVFSYDKLDWMNGLYLRDLAVDDFSRRMLPFIDEAHPGVDYSLVAQIAPLIQERIKRLSDAPEQVDFFFDDKLDVEAELLIQKGMDRDSTKWALVATAEVLGDLPTFDDEHLESSLRTLADRLGLKARQLFGAVRVAVTGRTVAPPLFGTLRILGRRKVLQRIRCAYELLDRKVSDGAVR